MDSVIYIGTIEAKRFFWSVVAIFIKYFFDVEFKQSWDSR